MFCYQCQETAQGCGCTTKGVCGKTDEVANLQDKLVYLTKGLSKINLALRQAAKQSKEVNHFIVDSLFMTITNANFDPQRFEVQIQKAFSLREKLKAELPKENLPQDIVAFLSLTEQRLQQMQESNQQVGVLSSENEDMRSLKELLTYGVKGMAAYAQHSANLGYEDDEIYSFIQQALASTTEALSVDELITMVLKCGEMAVKTMALLDKANTSKFGNPESTKVNIGVGKRPAILVSGHDFNDLQDLLEQTQDSGIEVYTHCEMLPAHYYPAFKQYKHLIGNYGSSWWHQNEDFESFNGVILFTTNCIIPPKSSSTYADRVYTTGSTGFTGFKHIEQSSNGKSKDFSALIAHAKTCKPPAEIEQGEIIGGFAHHQVFALADKVVEAVKSGAVRKFFVMAGCDGRLKSRSYYSEFAELLPKDTVILTAGCAKYRYNKLSLGDISGIPRVLDAGQCNDSYSLALIALKLKEVFGLEDINSLPIAYNIAWYEQKAVIVLLALLSLGVKNIHLGPTLPSFLSPNVAAVLVKNFGIAGIGSVDEDIKSFMA
ncbi:MAG: hydroxylamine reductase [Bacteroidales bacterium]|jgi:hydroxylamine reductase|nr:hydroxylamine reductase [Bacteroidales bacterium]